ncbi:MAG: hypothetical protein SVR08_14835, partial [Spirochaetota bacterium]|nr:hypothetical protein [Spirochaetota bacterium]
CTITQGINNTTNAGSENNFIKGEDLSEDNNEIRDGQSLSIEQVPESGQYTEIIDPENQSFINNTDDSSIEKNIPKIVSGGLQDEGISEEIFEKIEEMISNTSVPSGKEELYSRSMQNTFSEFKSIRNSTGMPAPELASIIYDIIVNEKIDDQYVNKSVYFEKDLESLIKESAKANPHKVKIRKDDINLTGETDYPYENRSDLSTETDLNTFLLSPAFKESGLTESEGEEITSYLKDVEIPSNSIMDLNRGVINIIKSHRNDIAPKNIAPIEAVKAVVHAVKGDHDKVPIEIREEIYSSISRENTRGIPVEHDRTGETKGRDREFIFPISEPDLSNYNIPADLDLSNDEDLNTFAHSPFMRESGLSDSESEEIVSYLRNTKTPPERSKDLTRGIVHTIRSYESNIAPKNITPIDAVKAVTHAVKGEHENVPLEIRDEIYNSISKKDAPDIPNEHDMSGETEKKYREFISPISNQDTGLDFSSFNLPDNFDLSNEEDINTFAKSPFMRENGLTDSDEKEIVSYLKNAKAPRERANDFTQGITQIIRSYKNNIAPKNITPIEAVKAVSHAVKGEHHRVPKEIENEIYKSLGERKFYASPIESWNNDEIFTSLSSEDGMEIDLLNRKDLNTFAQSSLMRNSGISETESDEIISYLKKAKIPIQSRQAFSNGVFNTLRSYKMDIAPHEINPADAVRSVGYAIHGQHDKIPEKIRPMILKNVLHEDRYNKQEQIPKINLMQNRGIDDFVDTQKFKQTGMLKEQFNELLSLHKGSYKGIQKEYYDHISVKYKSIKTGNGDNTANFNMPINANIQPSEQGNNIYNIGWHTKQHGQGPRMIKFTDLGNKKLNSLQKKGIAYGMKRDIQARKDSPPVINTISNKSGPIFEENIKSIPIGSPIASSKTSPVASPISSPITKDKNYIFTDPFASGKTKGNSVISQLPRLNSRQRIKTVDSMEKYSNQPYPAKSLTEEDKMKRIEDHYHEDKRMLAKTSSTESAYNRVQQSRTSNKYDISELLDTTISIIKNGITDE